MQDEKWQKKKSQRYKDDEMQGDNEKNLNI